MLQQSDYTYNEFAQKIYADSKIRIPDLFILASAIFIASIGLNMNSTPAVIGAMLISPLMSPILGIGVGLATYNTKTLNRSIASLGLEVVIALLISTIYFYFSPISYASAEILARTSPTLWDALIALFGGIAGIIGSHKKVANNIVPGVAIATALMPPLCTVGYAISVANWRYFFGASYLFIINAFFIILTTFIGTKILQHPYKKATVTEDSKKTAKTQWIIVVVTILLLIPSVLTAKSLVEQSVLEANVKNLISDEFKKATVIQQNIDKETQTITVTATGHNLSKKQIAAIQKKLPKYNLEGYKIRVNQIAELSQLSDKQFEDYINKLIARDRVSNQLVSQQSEQDKFEKMNKNIRELAPDEINYVITSTAYKNSKKVYLVDIKFESDFDDDDDKDDLKKALIKEIKKEYKNVAKITFED